MHLAQVVSFVSLCATRTWKNWKLPSVWKTVSYRVRRGRITISTGGCATGSTRCEVTLGDNFKPRLQSLVTQSE